MFIHMSVNMPLHMSMHISIHMSMCGTHGPIGMWNVPRSFYIFNRGVFLVGWINERVVVQAV